MMLIMALDLVVCMLAGIVYLTIAGADAGPPNTEADEGNKLN